MAASINDLITRVSDNNTGRPVISTLAAPGKALGATSANLSDATNWTNTSAVYFSIYTTVTVGSTVVKDPTSQTDWKATLAGTTLSGLVLTGGTDRAYTAGAIVEQTPTARYAKDQYDWGNSFANTDGTLKTTAVQAALNISGSAPADYTALATIPAVTASNGQKENVLTYSGVDYTDRLQKGTKLRIPRSVAPPAQSMSFTAASSQYATKASPTGITFTSAFTCEAWVYLNSYQTHDQAVLSRWDGTNGWIFLINASGQLNGGYYTSGANTTQQSYQSLPLKTWVHVALVVSSVSGKTLALYMNGVLIPSFANSSAATSFTQSGSLQVAAYNSLAATSVLDGYISEARIWSNAQTQTQIQNNIGISLVGTETGLVALFQGNGNFNDKTTNANNLTATGGAVATQASNPYSSVEYGIVTNVTYTGGNTVATVFTGPYVIPNATLGSTSYSSANAPYGFDNNKNKWRVKIPYRAIVNTLIGATGTQWFQSPVSIALPTGAWSAGFQGTIQQVSTVSGTRSAFFQLSSTTPITGVANPEDKQIHRLLAIGAADAQSDAYVRNSESPVSLTTYNIYGAIDVASGSESYNIRGDYSFSLIAEFTYL